MRRTFTRTPTFFRCLWPLLLSCWLLPLAPSLAQTLPAGEGQVADSTELRVLRQFYVSTGGAQWTTQTNWLQGTTLAQAATWYGVTVRGGDVDLLWLPGNKLRGVPPASLGQLRALHLLHLDDNALTALPATLGRLLHLEHLSVSRNQLTSLPDSLGRLSQLNFLDLGQNQLTGELPVSLRGLHQLFRLYLSGNQFTGQLPAWVGQWRGLFALGLDNNRFTGPLPDSLTTLPQLSEVSLSHNQFSGPLPATLGNLRYLRVLQLSQNAFTGPLPASLGQCGGLQYFFAEFNQLSGPLPAALGRCGSLSQLFLDHNQFSGSLPDSLATLTGLNYLHLGNNQFTGSIPAAFARFTNLAYLDLSYNQLSGLLPADLKAYQLLLGNNHLRGEVPASYGTTHNWQLLLENNDLTRIPYFAQPLGYPNLQLGLTGNLLAFDSYEPNQVTPGQWQFWDYGQRQPGPADTLQYVAGHPAQLDGRIGGAHNRYQWLRQVGGQWVEMPGQTQPTLRVPLVEPASAGLYCTRVTNDWVVDMTLYSRPHCLDVVPYPPLARNLPVDVTQVPHDLVPPLPAGSSLAGPAPDMNFVRSWAPRVALTQAGRVALAPVDSVSMSTQYLDGLGRPVQTVRHQASPQQRDLVQPQAYDALGREPRQFLPYPDSLKGRGGYRSQALSTQDAFYRRLGPAPGSMGPPEATDPTLGVARTGAAYAETLFEASPLNRVLAQGAAGETWQLTSGHQQERQERPNTAADSVLRFAPGYDPRSRDPGYQGGYAPGELWGTQERDEHGYHTLEWKDKLGQLVLKQVESKGPGMGSLAPSRWLRTAYVYDDFQRLRFILQPEATRRVLALPRNATGATPLPAAALPFVFHYRYDGRGRQVAKQVLGQDGETLVVYDQLDRPVLSQDAQQRTRQQWSFTKYDALGRPILSGLVTRSDTAGQVTLQNLATADTVTSHQYEQRTSSAATQYYTTTQAFPKLGSLGQQGFDGGQVLSATYYDDYDFDNNGQADLGYDTSTDGQFAAGPAPVADARRTQGLTTRTKTRMLGVAESDRKQSAWLTTTTFYDERARPVQVQTTTARKDTLRGQPYQDLLTTQLDFTGKVMQSVAVHQGPSHLPVQVAEYFTYDHAERLRTTRQQVLGADAQPVLLSQRHYNELGQLVIDSLGTGRLAQQLKYAYNIRGWLTKLNDPYQPVKEDLFNLSLHYETGFTRGYEQYNGNLTGQTWRGRDGVQRAYGYVYDPLNRLLQGDFVARTTTTPTTPTAGAWQAELDRYRLSFVSYDDNGNITTLRRRGLLQAATSHQAQQYGNVDNLSYAYQGNRLQSVDDAITGNQLAKPATYHGAPTSLAGDFQEAGVHQSQEYLYDANGNLSQDKNKGITGIFYNHLNLPRQLHFGTVGDSVVFRYAADGQKVAKLVYQTGQAHPQRTDYLGPYQYEGDSLRFFPHAEGRVLRFVQYDPAGQATVRYQREFTLKDHLGNLRLAYRAGQVRTLLATLEQDDNTHKRESHQFDSLSVSAPVAQNVSGLARSGQYVAKLNAGGSSPQPLGPLTQLGVQQGDTVTVSAFGYYAQPVQHGFLFSLGSFLAGLFHPAQAPTPGFEASRRKDLPLLQVGVAAGLASIPQLSGGVPKGYLRVLVFNQDSALVAQPVQALSQAARGGYEPLRLQVLVPQDGYITAYVGNESDVDVLFDDVQVEHRPGLQVQETQYDPAGLELAGLAAPSPGIKGLNNYRFNGKEFQADLGLAWNHQDWRFFDPQLLRWHVGDPEIENGQESWTPYSFGYDNAVRYSDANGREPGPGDPPTAVLPAPGVLQQMWRDITNPSDFNHFLDDLRSFPATGPEIRVVETLIGALTIVDNLNHLPAPTSQAAQSQPTSSATDTYGRVNATAGSNANSNTGRARNHLQPDSNATGPHSTFQRGADGKPKKYAEYTPNPKRPPNTKTGNPGGHEEVKRVDLDPNSAPHTNKQTGQSVPAPHVQGSNIPGGVRAARPDEIPK